MKNFSSVYICKADLDTIVAGFLLLGDTTIPVTTVVDRAPEDVLCNPSILCLECGGSGRTAESNFDHHDGNRSLPCAAEQAWNILGRPSQFTVLVQYTACMDTGCTPHDKPEDGVLSLSSLVSGMMLSVATQKNRFLEGLRLLHLVVENDLRPENSMRLCSLDVRAATYAKAKEHCRQQLQQAALARREWIFAGIRVQSLETPFPGVHGLLHSLGADISIAGNGTRWSISVNPEYKGLLQTIRNLLEQQEEGWGGPVHGTILGSPRSQPSRLNLQNLIDAISVAVVTDTS